MSAAAVAADEYVLTHKTVFPSSPRTIVNTASSASAPTTNHIKENRDCFYCHKLGHVIANCLALKRKEQAQFKPLQPQPKGVEFVSETFPVSCNAEPVDDCFKPFLFDGSLSLNGSTSDHRPVRILRDTACSQTVILSSVLPFSEQSACGYNSKLRGVEMGRVLKPVHNVYITSELITGLFPVVISSGLPIRGVDLPLGNDIAGGKVTPSLEVLDTPLLTWSSESDSPRLHLDPACVVTLSQARRNDKVILTDSLLLPVFSGETEEEVGSEVERTAPEDAITEPVNPNPPVPTAESSSLPVSQKGLKEEDPTLRQCFQMVVSSNKASGDQVKYFIDNGILMRRWKPRAAANDERESVNQIVVPTAYHQHVLFVAHESLWSGHIGITKMYNLILRHFFWHGFKSGMVSYCRSCHVCQLAGKPNQVIPPDPLHPNPVVGELFERVLVDCVGPLPRTKSCNQYLLTVMCAASRPVP